VTSQEAPRAASGLLLLADIGGYTSFLQSVALAHQDDAFADGAVPDAYAVMANLLDGIVGRVVPPLGSMRPAPDERTGRRGGRSPSCAAPSRARQRLTGPWFC
jgi:hypothetical protein